MKILKTNYNTNWNFLEKQKRFGNELYKTSVYKRNGLELTVNTTYKDGKKKVTTKELCDYLGQVISAKIVEFKNNIKIKENKIV